MSNDFADFLGLDRGYTVWHLVSRVEQHPETRDVWAYKHQDGWTGWPVFPDHESPDGWGVDMTTPEITWMIGHWSGSVISLKEKDTCPAP